MPGQGRCACQLGVGVPPARLARWSQPAEAAGTPWRPFSAVFENSWAQSDMAHMQIYVQDPFPAAHFVLAWAPLER